MWLVPDLIDEFNQCPHKGEIVFDCCAFGTSYKKGTRLWLFGKSPPKLEQKLKCQHIKGQAKRLCFFTGKPHDRLSGTDGKGFKSKTAQVYPWPLAEMAVSLFTK